MPKLLAIDDNLFNLKLLSSKLSGMQYEVLMARSGQEGLLIARESSPDLILLDLTMPEMDGFEVCRQLKTDPTLCDIPIIIVSAQNHEQDIIHALDVGATDFVTKPYNINILAARIRAIGRLKTAYDTIEELNQSLNLARKQAEQSAYCKDEFLANVSHELRTPLTAIKGYAELMLDPGVGLSDKLNYVQTIIRNTDHLLKIVGDILDLSNIESGKLVLERKVCSPMQIVGEATSLLRLQAIEKKLDFDVVYKGSIPKLIQTDPTRLQQILMNLISNAVKFTEAGSIQLTVKLSSPKYNSPHLVFEVVDTGPGMSEKQLQEIFTAFSQEDTSTTRKFGGLGLGLCLAKRLAQSLNGGLSAISEKNVGTTMTLLIPTGPLEGIEMLANPTEAVQDMEATKTTQTHSPRITGRILLAEDGPDNQRLISFLLRKAGAEVEIAENGKIAVQLAREKTFDLILMDMQMPEMDGYTATSYLRSRGYNRPIIALTAHAMVGDREKCLLAGCDDYATKPIQREIFFSVIQKYLPAYTK